MSVRHKLAVVLTAAALASGCSGSSAETEKDVSSSDSFDLTGPDVAAVAYLSTTIYESDGNGALVAILEDGTTRSVPVGALDNALIAAGPQRSLTYSSETRTATLRGGQVDVWRRSGKQQTGHWTGFAGGQSVAVFNTGVTNQGYVTDVFVTDGKTRQHAVVPDVPGATGVSPKAAWVLSGGSSNSDGRVTLYRVSLDRKTRVTSKRWKYHGGSSGGSFSEGSGIHAYRDRLWYLEQMGPSVNGRSSGRPQLRLAEVRSGSRGYVSHRLVGLKRYLYDDQDGVNRVAASARQGHLYRGSLFAIDGDGAILRVNLERARLSVVGKLSARARDSARAAVSWSRGHVTVLGQGKDSTDMFVERYSLKTGSRTASISVAPTKEFSDPELVLWSMAVPNS